MTNDVVLFVLIGLAAVAIAACAISVFASWKACAAANRIRGTTSALAELHEIRDYVGKLDAWAKRINAREIRNERADPNTGQIASVRTVSKAELRRRVGIVPGRPAPHTE